MFTGLWRDLMHAARALAKARSFTLVCVVSLGIGMAPVIAIPYLSRVLDTHPPGVNTERLAEILTIQSGPREPADVWSYPDYVDLRDQNELAYLHRPANLEDLFLKLTGRDLRD